uniref:hypothetical protein n=1 Tax=Lachnoclostridium phocaeense TaxID=1871021 RepID=UPI0026DC760A|nr:hypothetical protein [Lachnoclostridium phocaeense]
MLVPVYRKLKNGRGYEESLDTDDLSDEDFAEFCKLWYSDNKNDKMKAKLLLAERREVY